MKLPPSMMSRKRYIAFRIIAEGSVSEKILWDAMMKNLISLFGEVEALDAGVKLEEFDGNKGIISCKLEALKKVMIAMTLIDKLGEMDVALITLGISGTIKKCRKRLEVVS
ncbi:MAG: Rpp14/Pop5 family protein [Archaeoglobaceae archaeon]|uniref:Ribonuclease P protein component 2 n=1 Tax=Archaeoglobus fulgidus TaxID=2234 RepID=A0A7J3M2Y9_ARCFL